MNHKAKITEQLSNEFFNHSFRKSSFLYYGLVPVTCNLALERQLWEDREEVEANRLFSKDDPEYYLPQLAITLSNLGGSYSELGKMKEAVAVTQEAVEIGRKLVRNYPPQFQKMLAGLLDNLGNRLYEAGQRKAALRYTTEAVALFRKIAKDDKPFYRDLSQSLARVGLLLCEAGQKDKALEVAREAVSISRGLVYGNLDNNLACRLKCLNSLVLVYQQLGKSQEAQLIIQEAEVFNDNWNSWITRRQRNETVGNADNN